MLMASVSPQLQRSLRRFIAFDQGSCLAAIGGMVGVHTFVHHTGYLLILSAIVAATAGVLGLARRPVARGNFRRAVLWIALANWTVALAATAIATFCVPITVVAAMLPSAVAVPYVDART